MIGDLWICSGCGERIITYRCAYCHYEENNYQNKSHTRNITVCTRHEREDSHYYCTKHSTICSGTSHTVRETKECEHGKTSQHSCCDHGNTSLHFPN